MSLSLVAIVVLVIFFIAYRLYGQFLSRVVMKLDDQTVTPACTINDGDDFVPAEKKFLLGQHFSAISAAGPIVGPILGAMWFGWMPVLLWIVFGCIFFGAVHDFSSLIGSVRHNASSVVEMMRVYLGRKGYLFFLIFVWVSLIYVIIAFTDLTSSAFVSPGIGPAVASSSAGYLLIGLVMGVLLYRFKWPLLPVSIGGLVCVILVIWCGRLLPISMPTIGALDSQKVWNILILAYCFIASVIPVWLLLQPRGYLGGLFLYGTLAMGLIGLFLGGEQVAYPAWTGFYNAKGMPLFPVLFVTVACGACSGFHGIVCSGTTSKQISKENDCRLVGYGGMLLEGVVALVALATIMIVAKSDPLATSSPDRIYSEGLSRFVSRFGISAEYAKSFALLAFTTFIYDTLDVATRLARYILQELLGMKSAKSKYLATFLTLLIPLVCVSITLKDASGAVVPAWKVFWTLFGTSNQLLAALTMMMLTVWLYKKGSVWMVCAVPMAFLMVCTLYSLVLMIRPTVVGLVSAILCALSLLLIWEAYKSLRTPEVNKST